MLPPSETINNEDKSDSSSYVEVPATRTSNNFKKAQIRSVGVLIISVTAAWNLIVILTGTYFILPTHYASFSGVANVGDGAASTPTKQQLPDHKNVTKSNSFFDVLYVDLISMQRSSSTNLLYFALPKWNSCFVPLNEIFNANDVASEGGPWSSEGRDLLKLKKVQELDPLTLQNFLWRVSQRKCLEKEIDSERKCEGKCVVAFKEFYEHLTPDQHRWLWKNTPNLVPVILERNVEDRWKSKWLALNTGDWDIEGSAKHEAKLAAQHVPPLNYSNTMEVCQNETLSTWGMCGFQKFHEAWYKMARYAFPPEKRVELSFDETTTDGGFQAVDRIVKAFPARFQEWWWKMNDNNPKK